MVEKAGSMKIIILVLAVLLTIIPLIYIYDIVFTPLYTIFMEKNEGGSISFSFSASDNNYTQSVEWLLLLHVNDTAYIQTIMDGCTSDRVDIDIRYIHLSTNNSYNYSTSTMNTDSAILPVFTAPVGGLYHLEVIYRFHGLRGSTCNLNILLKTARGSKQGYLLPYFLASFSGFIMLGVMIFEAWWSRRHG